MSSKPEMETKEMPKKKKAKRERPILRSKLPDYLFVQIMQNGFVGDDTHVSIFQLKQPILDCYEGLNETQNKQVAWLFAEIQHTKPGLVVMIPDMEIEAGCQGGEEYGGEMTQADFLLEGIATRLSKDDTGLKRTLVAPIVREETLSPMDLVGDKIAHLLFLT